MTGPFSARRSAEEFDAALSRPLTEQDATAFADLLTLVRDLRAIPAPQPRPEFVAGLRERLLAEADTALIPQSARPLTADEQRLVLPVRSYRRDRRLATLLGAAALVGATTSMAVAAQTALPGESLYPVKRAIENAQTGIARDDAGKGAALLANARGRLDEVRDLAERGGPASTTAVAPTLEAFTEQAGEASDVLFAAYDDSGDEAVLTRLRSFSGASMDRLAELESVVPTSARGALVAAGEQLADIDRQTSLLCPDCGGAITSIPPSLLASGNTMTGVNTVIVAASQNPVLLEPPAASPKPSKSQEPDPISGSDVEGVDVPDDLPTAGPTPTADPDPTPAPSPTASPSTPVKVDVKTPVNDVTKLLTGDLTTATANLPVANQVLTDVGTTLNGTVDGVQGTLDGVTGSLLP